MRCSLTPPLVLKAFVLLIAAALVQGDGLSTVAVLRRDDHHHPQGAPLLELNETEITVYHSPTPDSYYTVDWEGAGGGARYPALMMTHIILMCLAFFVALPMGT
jgi:hypothetical protein